MFARQRMIAGMCVSCGKNCGFFSACWDIKYLLENEYEFDTEVVNLLSVPKQDGSLCQRCYKMLSKRVTAGFHDRKEEVKRRNPQSTGALPSDTALETEEEEGGGGNPQSTGALPSDTALETEEEEGGGGNPQSTGALSSDTAREEGGEDPQSTGALPSDTALETEEEEGADVLKFKTKHVAILTLTSEEQLSEFAQQYDSLTKERYALVEHSQHGVNAFWGAYFFQRFDHS